MKPQTIWQGGLPAFVRQAHDEVRRSEAEKERKRLEQAARREASRRRPWTDEENALMRKHYPTEGASERLQEMLGRDARSVRAQAGHLGLRVQSRALSRLRTVAARKREDMRKRQQMQPVDVCSPEIEREFKTHEARKQNAGRASKARMGAWWRKVNAA